MTPPKSRKTAKPSAAELIEAEIERCQSTSAPTNSYMVGRIQGLIYALQCLPPPRPKKRKR